MQRARTTLFYYFIFSYLILHAFYFEGMPRETNKGWGGGLCTPISLPPPPLSSYTEKRSKRQLYMSLDEMNTKRTEYKPESSASQSVETKARVTCTRHSRGDASARILSPLANAEFMKYLPFLAASSFLPTYIASGSMLAAQRLDENVFILRFS